MPWAGPYCDTCKWFDLTSKERGRCRVEAPKMSDALTDSPNIGSWPVVMITDGCRLHNASTERENIAAIRKKK